MSYVPKAGLHVSARVTLGIRWSGKLENAGLKLWLFVVRPAVGGDGLLQSAVSLRRVPAGCRAADSALRGPVLRLRRRG